jgi:hypothetical protein
MSDNDNGESKQQQKSTYRSILTNNPVVQMIKNLTVFA